MTRRNHLRADIMTKSYSKSGVIAYIEAFSIQSAGIGASWAVGRLPLPNRVNVRVALCSTPSLRTLLSIFRGRL